MKVMTRVVVELDENELFDWSQENGRDFQVRVAFLHFGPGKFEAQLSGPIALLRGGYSVNEWSGCAWIEDMDLLPEILKGFKS